MLERQLLCKYSQKDFSASAYRSFLPIHREAGGTAHKECFIFGGGVGEPASAEFEGKAGQRVAALVRAGK